MSNQHRSAPAVRQHPAKGVQCATKTSRHRGRLILQLTHDTPLLKSFSLPHGDRKGRHYYITGTRRSIVVASPCGRHAIVSYPIIQLCPSSCYNAAKCPVVQKSWLQRASHMYTQILSFCLGALGIIGTAALVTTTAIIMYYYRGTRLWSFRW